HLRSRRPSAAAAAPALAVPGRGARRGRPGDRRARARPAPGVPVQRLRPEPADDSRDRKAAGPRRAPGRPLALLARRHGLLLNVRLVFVTQRVDPQHPALAATVEQIAALAERADEVSVLAGDADGALPDNTRVRLFAAPTRAGRGLRFEAAL